MRQPSTNLHTLLETLLRRHDLRAFAAFIYLVYRIIDMEGVYIPYVTNTRIQFSTDFFRAFHQKVIASDNNEWIKEFYAEVDELADQICESFVKSTKGRYENEEFFDYGPKNGSIVTNFKTICAT